MRPIAGALALAFMAVPLALSFSPASLRASTRTSKVPRGRTSCSRETVTSKPVDLVTKILEQIEGTDRGASTEPAKRKEIDSLIEQLNSIGEDQDWLSNPKLFGNYNVAYVSSGKAEKSSPAGGRFRGRFGRAIFRTEDLFQHLIAPATAVNMVSFRAFGVLKGCVTLRGDFQAMDDRPNFVRADFDPPLINFLGKHGLTFRMGPTSAVSLAATYVDERVRIGKGGRGSLFVFTRGGPASTPAADMWKIYSARPVRTRVLGAVVACGAAALAVHRVFVPATFGVVFSTFLLLSRGGID